MHSIKRNQYQRDQFEKDLKAKQEKQREEREKERPAVQSKSEEKQNEDRDDDEDYTPKFYGNRKKQVDEAPHLSPHSDQAWDHTGWEEIQRDRRRSVGMFVYNSITTLQSMLIPIRKSK